MTTKLRKLHARLGALRRRRSSVRWLTGYSAMAVALLWLLVALFLADWLLRMNRPERIVGMVVCAGVLVWAFRRYTVPWLGHRETELDMALMVEKQQRIDSDVVAAIQFESPEAPQWGSVRLEEAVIDHTAPVADRINVTEGIPREALVRRMTALALTGVLLAIGVWQFPAYFDAFLNRLLLGSRHYPSKTLIEIVRINGREVDLSGWRSTAVKVSYGKPVRFEVTCRGELPESGEVSMKTIRGGMAASVTLNRTEPNPKIAESRIYASELPRLIDSVNYQVFVGDAWTDPAELLLVPLPLVDVQMEVAPPKYAAAEAAGPSAIGMRQISVLEGSQVTLRIVSDKRLKEAKVTIEGKDAAYDMVRDEAPLMADVEDCWKLAPAETPLGAVTEPVHFSVQATDADGLQLERPIQGVIRIRADQPPRILASAITKIVLPTAKPTLTYQASDDFGLAQIAVVPEVVKSSGITEQREEIVIYRLPEGQEPKRLLQDGHPLDLTPLKLVKGDQLKISLRAVDYRGSEKGKSSLSEPLVFQVTDEAGILAAISEADKESAKQLRIMIERQIDVGEGR